MYNNKLIYNQATMQNILRKSCTEIPPVCRPESNTHTLIQKIIGQLILWLYVTFPLMQTETIDICSHCNILQCYMLLFLGQYSIDLWLWDLERIPSVPVDHENKCVISFYWSCWVYQPVFRDASIPVS